MANLPGGMIRGRRGPGKHVGVAEIPQCHGDEAGVFGEDF